MCWGKNFQSKRIQVLTQSTMRQEAGKSARGDTSDELCPFGCLLNPQGRHQARTKDWVIQTGVIQTILFFHPVSRHTNTKHKSYAHPKHQTPSFCIEYKQLSQTNNGDGWSIASTKTFNMSQMLIPSLMWAWYSWNWGTPLHRNRYDRVSP